LVRLGGFVWVMGALRDDGESPRRRKRYASGECGADYAGGKGVEKESGRFRRGSRTSITMP
jgi:hypothetical protein